MVLVLDLVRGVAWCGVAWRDVAWLLLLLLLRARGARTPCVALTRGGGAGRVWDPRCRGAARVLHALSALVAPGAHGAGAPLPRIAAACRCRDPLACADRLRILPAGCWQDVRSAVDFLAGVPACSWCSGLDQPRRCVGRDHTRSRGPLRSQPATRSLAASAVAPRWIAPAFSLLATPWAAWWRCTPRRWMRALRGWPRSRALRPCAPRGSGRPARAGCVCSAGPRAPTPAALTRPLRRVRPLHRARPLHRTPAAAGAAVELARAAAAAGAAARARDERALRASARRHARSLRGRMLTRAAPRRAASMTCWPRRRRGPRL